MKKIAVALLALAVSSTASAKIVCTPEGKKIPRVELSDTMVMSVRSKELTTQSHAIAGYSFGGAEYVSGEDGSGLRAALTVPVFKPLVAGMQGYKFGSYPAVLAVYGDGGWFMEHVVVGVWGVVCRE